MVTLGIVSIATNIYLDYWKAQAKSVDENLDQLVETTLHIFTDRPNEALEHGRTLKHVRVIAHQIPAYGWPEATLYRYEIMHKESDQLQQDVLMYLDADMLIARPIGLKDFETSEGSGVTLVRHPGFYRPVLASSVLLYLRNPALLTNDIYTSLKVGGLGSWETSSTSLAYVPRKLRRNYYCGGVWWGYNAEFKELVKELAERVSRDEENQVMATWHDESHLNWWASTHQHVAKDSSYCYSISYPWLKQLPMIIQAVDKQVATR